MKGQMYQRQGESEVMITTSTLITAMQMFPEVSGKSFMLLQHVSLHTICHVLFIDPTSDFDVTRKGGALSTFLSNMFSPRLPMRTQTRDFCTPHFPSYLNATTSWVYHQINHLYPTLIVNQAGSYNEYPD